MLMQGCREGFHQRSDVMLGLATGASRDDASGLMFRISLLMNAVELGLKARISGKDQALQESTPNQDIARIVEVAGCSPVPARQY